MTNAKRFDAIAFDADDTLWFSEDNRLEYKPVNLEPMNEGTKAIALAKRTY